MVRDADSPSNYLDDNTTPSRPAWQGGELSRGRVVEGYVIIGRVGEGGMGVVYSAYDPKLERKVAIKVVRPSADQSGDATQTQRMLREAQAMAKLSHPNVAAVYQVGQLDNSVFIVMEYIEGGTLKHWLRGQARRWQDIVDVLVKAGRGLEAAHNAQMLHRDFKPDNILIGNDGRVRVTDFGLARLQRTPEPVTRAQFSDSTLTTTGAVMGTPAYMAPELLKTVSQVHQAVPVDVSYSLNVDALEQSTAYSPPPVTVFQPTGDARADQFSFCVTLYEALCGVRPFAGQTMREVVRNITTGNVQPWPPNLKVPRSVRQVVMKGLSQDPTQRYPSMSALLALLERRPISRMNVAIAVVAIAAIATAGVLFARNHNAAAPQCLGSEQRLADIWNTKVKETLAKAFDQSKLPYAATARDSVFARLDAYHSEWVKMHTDTCEATRVRGEQSEQLLDRRMLCLDRRRSELAAFTDVLAKGTPDVIRSAVVTSQRLSPIEDCSAANQAHIDSPSPETRAATDQLGPQLAKAKVLFNAGSFDTSIALAKETAEKAHAQKVPRLEAEALLIQGMGTHSKGDIDAAEDLFVRAVAAADESNDREVKAEAFTELVYLAGFDRANLADANKWAKLAEPSVASGVGGVALQARLLNNRGAALFVQGHHAEALELIAKARDLRRQLYPQGHADLADSLNNVGSLQLMLGQTDQAVDTHREAVAMFEKMLGAEHPSTADALNNLANDYVSSDQPVEAEKLYQRALEIYIKSLGPTHASVAVTMTNLATLALGRKEYDAAISELNKALEIEQATWGPTHPTVAETLANIGRAELKKGEPRKALEQLNNALAIWGKLDKMPPVGYFAEFALAQSLWQLKDKRRAMEAATHARDGLKVAGPAWTSTVEDIDAWIAHPT